MVKKIINSSPKIVQKALTNKYILYGVLVTCIVHIIGYIQMNQWDALALFMASLVIMTYFSKNMTVNLLVSLFLANCKVCMEFVSDVQKFVGLREGFKEGAAKYTKNDKGECVPEGSDNTKDCGQSGVACYNDDKCENQIGTESFGGKNKGGNLVKEAASATGEEDEAPGKRLDYAATYEMAINNLDKMLGKKGMAGLTKETEKLVSQQKGLMESLNNMAPVLESAKKTLDNMNMPDIDKMSDMLSKMNGGAMPGLMPKMQNKK